MNTFTAKMFLAIGLGVLATVPAARADQWNQRTVITFSDSVEVPGQTLPAGTYVFKVVNSPSSRHIVQVFNNDEKQVIATFLAIPTHRSRASGETIIRFEERAAGSPQAVKSWFYPGKTHGHEFVYPKKEALELAQANNLPVPAIPLELITEISKRHIVFNGPEMAALESVPLKAEEPNGDEVELAAAFPNTGHPAVALPDELPHTASPLPLIGMMGLLSLGTAASLRLRAARAK